MRLRIKFAKTEAMRFTSHLDLYRAWERTLRRAGMKLVFSQGYNPRPKIQIAAALPLGFTSQAEILDVWLNENRSLAQIWEELVKRVPPGIEIIDIQMADEHETALQNRVMSAEYLIELIEIPTDLEKRIDSLLDSRTLPRQWKGKPYDLRPLIEKLEVDRVNQHGQIRLRLQVKAEEGKTGRPEEVLAALGIPIDEARIHRTAMFLRDN